MHEDENLKELFKGYKLEGDIYELYNLTTLNSRIAVHLRDIFCALSKCKINHIRVGYGDSLTEAYQKAEIKGCTCRLVHFHLSNGFFGVHHIYNFITGIGKEIIFGCALNGMNGYRVKLVMIFN